jgi:ABC-type branched-subunit amino acid transport system substrate-binding protein
MKLRRNLAVVLGVGCVALFSALATGSQASRSATKPVVLWALMDVTVPPGQDLVAPSAEATVKAINAFENGINGRQLKLNVCDTALNPSRTASCAQQAVAAGAPAVISYARNGGSYMSILESAHIPVIGNPLLSLQEQNSPVSFPVTGGGPAAVAAFAVVGKQQKCKSMSWIAAAPTQAAAAYAVATKIWRDKLADFGIKSNDVILAPPGSPDFAPFVRAAVDQGSDCVVLAAAGPDMVGLLPAVKRGYRGKIIVARQNLDRPSTEALGSALNGVFLTDSLWPETNPGKHAGMLRFVNDMRRFYPGGLAKISSRDANSWVSLRLFAYVARRVKTINQTTILNALNHLRNYDPGVSPPFSYNKPAPGAVVPRQFSPYVMLDSFKDGRYVPIGFVNLGSGKLVRFPSKVVK